MLLCVSGVGLCGRGFVRERLALSVMWMCIVYDWFDGLTRGCAGVAPVEEAGDGLLLDPGSEGAGVNTAEGASVNSCLVEGVVCASIASWLLVWCWVVPLLFFIFFFVLSVWNLRVCYFTLRVVSWRVCLPRSWWRLVVSWLCVLVCVLTDGCTGVASGGRGPEEGRLCPEASAMGLFAGSSDVGGECGGEVIICVGAVGMRHNLWAWLV